MKATIELLATIANKWIEKRPFSKQGRERRQKRRAANRRRRRGEPPEPGDEAIFNEEGLPMDIQAFVIQIIMAAIRHGLTAGGLLGTVVSDQQFVQIGGVVALVVGGVWSAWRKYKAAKAATPTA